MSTKKAKQPFPLLLNLIQIYNYTVIVLAALVGVMFAVLPNERLFEFNDQQTPLNKYIASALSITLMLLVVVAAYLIRERKKIAPQVFAILTIASYPLNELLGHFSNSPDSETTAYVFGVIDIVTVGYLLLSKRVHEIMVR